MNAVYAFGAVVVAIGSATAGITPAHSAASNDLFGLDALTGNIVVIEDATSQTGTIAPTRVIQTGLGQLSDNGASVELAASEGLLYVADRDDVSVFNIADGTLARSFTMSTRTRGLAAGHVDGMGLTLFNWTNGDDLELLDPVTGALRQTFSISNVSVPTGAAFDPSTGEVIVGALGGEGEIIRIDPATGIVKSRVSAMNRDYSGGLAVAGGVLYGVQPFGSSRDTFQRIAADGTFSEAFDLAGTFEIAGIAGIPTPGSLGVLAVAGMATLRRRRGPA